MLRSILVWGPYSLILLIVESIKYACGMSKMVPCRVTITNIERNPAKNKTFLCKYTLSGSYAGGIISDTIEELVPEGKDEPYANGRTYDMRVDPQSGHCYDPNEGKKKIKGHAKTLAMCVGIIAGLLLVMYALNMF